METLSLFWELIDSGFGINGWIYTDEGEYLNCNMTDDPVRLAFLDRIFTFTGCKQAMLNLFSEHRQPTLFSAPLGFVWLADVQVTKQGSKIYHVLGPALSSMVAEENAYQRFTAFHPELAEAHGRDLVELIKTLPVLPQTLMNRLALMLHRYVTGEKTTIEEIAYQNGVAYQSGITSDALQAESEKTSAKWIESSHIMELVRTGDVDKAHAFVLEMPDKTRHTLETSDKTRHALETSDKTRHALQSMQFTAVAVLSYATHAATEGGLPSDIVSTLAVLYRQNIAECQTTQEIQSVTRTMLEDFASRVRHAHASGTLSKEIQSCCEYVKFHTESRLTVEGLADRLGYAKYYLTKKFKKETGQNLRDYIRMQKVERAKFLLQNSQISIQQISDLLCFSSCSYFSVVFRKLTGLSPQEYRNTNGMCL